MDLYLLFRMPWEDLESDERVDIRTRIASVIKSFKISDIFIGRGDVALCFSGREFKRLTQAELDKVSGTRVTFPMATAMDSFFFNVEDQLSDSDEYPSRTREIEEMIKPYFNSICYHCGARSVKLFSSNECSKNCQGGKK